MTKAVDNISLCLGLKVSGMHLWVLEANIHEAPCLDASHHPTKCL